MLVFFEHLQLTFYRMCCYFNLKKNFEFNFIRLFEIEYISKFFFINQTHVKVDNIKILMYFSCFRLCQHR